MKTESRIQQDCYLWFHNSFPELRGLLFRVKNEGINRISGSRDKAMGVVPGVSDMILLTPLPGRPVLFEFKIETGKQSESQKKWQRIVENAGYQYIIIRSLEVFKNVLSKEINGSYPDTKMQLKILQLDKLKKLCQLD